MRDSTGYNKFREKFARYHKNRGQFRGEYA